MQIKYCIFCLKARHVYPSKQLTFTKTMFTTKPVLKGLIQVISLKLNKSIHDLKCKNLPTFQFIANQKNSCFKVAKCFCDEIIGQDRTAKVERK